MNVIDEIAAERKRQVEAEGWTPEHDDGHEHEELARAAACYACPPEYRNLPFTDGDNVLDRIWPWWDDAVPVYGPRGEYPVGYERRKAWWKPAPRRRSLIKAAALIVAEIERLDRSPS